MAEKKMVEQITSMDVDFAQWYTDIVKKADLVDYSSVKGCMIIRPYGYAIWENIQKILDTRFKELGHENVYMPMFITESLLQKEKDHVAGFAPEVSEPLKIVINASRYGYTGDELSEHLRECGIECEFSDRDYLVLMATPENAEDSDKDFERLYLAFTGITPKAALAPISTALTPAKRKTSVREAIFSKSERISTEKSLGRILATPTVSCPPAVPIAISGELIDENVQKALVAYGIDEVEVVL